MLFDDLRVKLSEHNTQLNTHFIYLTNIDAKIAAIKKEIEQHNKKIQLNSELITKVERRVDELVEKQNNDNIRSLCSEIILYGLCAFIAFVL
jgi:Leucine-rich repeat (LRR) protein